MDALPPSLPNAGQSPPAPAANPGLAILLADLSEALSEAIAKLPATISLAALVTQVLPQSASSTTNAPLPGDSGAPKTPLGMLVQITTPNGSAQIRLPPQIQAAPGTRLDITVTQAGLQPQWRLTAVNDRPVSQAILTATTPAASPAISSAPSITAAQMAPRPPPSGIAATLVTSSDPSLPSGTALTVRITGFPPPPEKAPEPQETMPAEEPSEEQAQPEAVAKQATPSAPPAPSPATPTVSAQTPAPVPAPAAASAPAPQSPATPDTPPEEEPTSEPPSPIAAPAPTTTPPSPTAAAAPAPAVASPTPASAMPPVPTRAPPQGPAPVPAPPPPAMSLPPLPPRASPGSLPMPPPTPMSAPAPVPMPTPAPIPTAVSGQVLPNTDAGKPLVLTPLGLISLDTGPQTLPAEATVTLEVVGQPVPPPAASAPDDPPDQALPKKLAQVIEEARSAPDGDKLAEAARDKIPAAGPKLAAQLLSAIAAADPDQPQGASRLFGEGLATALSHAAPQAMEALTRHWDAASSPVQGPGDGEWRALMIPFMIGSGEMSNLRLAVRRRKGGKLSPAEAEKGTRFLLDFDLSRLGPMQFDGLVKRQHKRFDLIIRTLTPLPGEMRRDIDALFIAGLLNFGLEGSVAFKGDGRFVATPRMTGDSNGMIFA